MIIVLISIFRVKLRIPIYSPNFKQNPLNNTWKLGALFKKVIEMWL